jgi:uncharacterized membrane protein
MDRDLKRLFGYAAACAGLFALYNTLRIEIDNFFHLQALSRGAAESLGWLGGAPGPNRDLGRFNLISQIQFTLLFLTVMAVANIRKLRSVIFAAANVSLGLFCLLVFLTAGMAVLYELQLSYTRGGTIMLLGLGWLNIAERYISYAFAAGLLAAFYEYSRNDLLGNSVSRSVLNVGFDGVFYPTLLIAASCELMNLAGQLAISDADKYGLSILWGVFALAMIVIGIARSKKHLRISAFVLLAMTLGKLFFYDISELGTIPKTILFVALGMLLLVVSFLYNKYKNFIFGTPAEKIDEETNYEIR